MKKLLFLLLILTTGCQAVVTNAEANLTEAQTEQIEVQSDAETIAALVAELRERDDLDQDIINALLVELEAGRASRYQTEVALLELVRGIQRARAPWWVGLFIATVLGIASFFVWREQHKGQSAKRVIVMMLPEGCVPQLVEPGSWEIVPHDVRVQDSVAKQ